jgi:hypothetical protein
MRVFKIIFYSDVKNRERFKMKLFFLVSMLHSKSVGENILSFFFRAGFVCGKKMKVCFVRWQKKEIKNEALPVRSKRCRLLSM